MRRAAAGQLTPMPNKRAMRFVIHPPLYGHMSGDVVGLELNLVALEAK